MKTNFESATNVLLLPQSHKDIPEVLATSKSLSFH
jgi:hypothetical protein